MPSLHIHNRLPVRTLQGEKAISLSTESMESQSRLFCKRMKRVEARILENEQEDPRTEPDQEPNTWLIQGKLREDIVDWENARLDFQTAEIEAEIIESSMSEPSCFTIRTSGKSPLQKGDSIHVNIR